jgi:hypothetical protein
MIIAPVRTPRGGRNRRASREPEGYGWPLVAIVVAILPQVLVPADHRLGPPLAVPIIETAVFLAMVAITALPGPVPARARPAVLASFAILIGANAVAAVRLVALVLGSGKIDGVPLSASRLLTAAAMVLTTNLITFGLVYWQLDSGGPAGRARVPGPLPDFQFPQSAMPQIGPTGWHARFPDYLYLAYTNVVAFSPTDAMPLTARAKGLMALQSLISLAVLVVVLARVINMLPA